MGITAHLRRRLPNFDIRVDLQCPSGSLTAIVGPSGAGKSTLIRLVAGLDTPDWGRVAFDDTVVFDKAAGINVPTRNRRVGMVFQDYPLFEHLTVAANVAFSCPDPGRIHDLLQSFGIAHLADRKPGTISGGERQRAALCQALARDPAILLLDEPFSALDAPNRAALRRELRFQTARMHIPILLVTHDLAEAAELADTVFPMAAGLHAPAWLDEALNASRRLAATLTTTTSRICA